MKAKLLLLETSDAIGQVGLSLGQSLVATQSLDAGRRHNRDVAPTVCELLQRVGWHIRDLDAVIVSRGPGSYTGLRVGIMSAKTLAYALGCKIIAVDTFACLAWQAPVKASPLDVIADAQQNRIYVQSFQWFSGKGCWLPTSPLAIKSFDSWLVDRPNEGWLTGPGLRVYASKLSQGHRILRDEPWQPQLTALLDLGLERFDAEAWSDPWTLEPLYLRGSAAEEKWRQRDSGGSDST
jgi:tRNA threonylcarbamoyladenosine biosynthesis protein TsaB